MNRSAAAGMALWLWSAAGACAAEPAGDLGAGRTVSTEPSRARCESCHATQAAQWERSRHHAAFTNADFQRSYTREPEEFCRGCHAPETRQAGSDPKVAEARGVRCVDCHGDAASVRTGMGRQGAEVSAPHPLERSDDFGTQACAGCHEFAFPPGARQPPGAMMQTTMREHLASEHAETDCATCHLPRVDAGAGALADHSLASTRNDAAWRQALDVAVQSVPGGVSFELTPNHVGHALPTGDLFRRFVLRAERRNGADMAVATNHRYLGRHFEPLRRPDGTYNRAHDWPTPDDRLRGPTTVVLKLDEAASTEVSWRVDYERVDNRDPAHPDRSSIASTVRIASGRLQHSASNSP